LKEKVLFKSKRKIVNKIHRVCKFDDIVDEKDWLKRWSLSSLSLRKSLALLRELL